MDSLIEALSLHAQRQPTRPALFFADQTISYQDLFASGERFAQALLAWGLRTGDRVALFMDNSPTFVTTYLGVQLAGGIVVLVNTQYRQVELSHIMTDAGVRLCVTSAQGAHELQRLSLLDLALLITVDDPEVQTPTGTIPCLTFAAFGAQYLPLSPSPLSLPGADAPALLAYTSGTTGRAKGALLSQRNLLANITTLTTAWCWTEQDRLLLALPLFHAHGLMVGLHGTLFTGASAVLHVKFVAADILAALQNDPQITLFFGVPTMYARLLKELERQEVPLPRLRLFVSGSAPLSPQLFLAFERLSGQRILERYGMTETIMNMTNPYEGERRAGTVGAPFPGQEARIVDVRTRELLPAGEIGEIEVRGPHVFSGYWNRPDATAEAFSADGWFKTGDLGWCSDDGYYTITGRARELIISGGYNIYPREV
ncbi:MAG TPA: AMP-binding protein, partial [Ktedonobacteraceae bacterium]